MVRLNLARPAPTVEYGASNAVLTLVIKARDPTPPAFRSWTCQVNESLADEPLYRSTAPVARATAATTF
jgi:hypothetical protein